MSDEFKIHRFIDAGDEPNQVLIPIEGYENKELVPLDKAVELIKTVSHKLDIMVHTALQNSTEPSNGLTANEAAAIHLYTMQWPESHESLYDLLNRTLRSEKRNELRPWFSYLKLILTALCKLPPIKTTLWRAIRGNVNDQYKTHKIWWGFSSCTESRKVAEQFVGSSGERTVFKIECVNGRCIESYSYFKDEKEIILMPGTYLHVLKRWTDSDGVHMIELQEMEPPYQLITPPFVHQKP
ncbi:unnamed protein product, partial [Rotaria magnacalcarata]